MVEKEAFGVTYERYALFKAQERLVKKYRVRTVLELPAHGAKAAPSLYSLGFAQAGCQVTLANPNEKAIDRWHKLGLGKNLKTVKSADLTKSNLAERSFDLVWNFVYLPLEKSPEDLIREMRRLSKRLVMVASVNNLNPGFTVHCTLHKILKIPWTHGDRRFNSARFVKKFFRKQGLKIKEVGLVDAPPWPDSLGFRDVRLHRAKIEEEEPEWEIPFIDHLKSGDLPGWIKLVYLWERIPIPFYPKTFYSHLFYTVGER
jgi:hypothetical protein